MPKICSIDGCERVVHARGLCDFHYRRSLRDYPMNFPHKKDISSLRKMYPYEYDLWKGMMQRCYNANNKAYYSYGGRGIKVCDRWRGHIGFKNFIEDMGPRPKGEYRTGSPKYTLDRVDNNKGYSPENCRWADRRVQRINQRRTKEYVAFGYKGTWSELYAKFALSGISEKTAWRRFKQLGWSLEESITTPLMR